MLDPERIVVTGEFARAGELLLGPLRHALEARILIEPDGIPDVVQGQLGSKAAVTGALSFAIDSTDLRQSTWKRPVHLKKACT